MEEWLDFTEFLDKTQELIDLGLYEEALRLLDDYTNIYHEEWEFYYLYSRIYTEQNQPEKAIPFLHKGLRVEKTNADCLLGLFYAYAMANQVKKGGRYLLRAYKYHPDHEQIKASLVWYYTEVNETETALKHFEELQKKGTANPEAFRNGGIAYERAGLYDEAELCFKAALDLNPQFDEVRDMLADHYLILDDSQKAVALYQEALKESPRNIRILSRLVFCYSQAGQHDQASSLAKETIRLYPNSPIGYVDLSYACLNTNDFDKAIESAERAIDISPIDPEAFRVKGIAYSEKKEFQKAEEAFEKAISLDDRNPEIIRDYYHHLRNSGKFEKMEEWVQTAINLEYPHCMEDYWFLADYFREKGMSLKAFQYLHKAYKSVPVEKELIPPMVDILLERGHTTYSVPFLIRYVEKSGWNDVMNEFAQHKRLKGKWAQEGIRFLRFWGQRSIDYRRFIFALYIRKFAFVFTSTILALSIVPLYLLFGLSGLVLGFLGYGLLYCIYFAIRFLARKKIPGFRKVRGVFS